MKFKAPEKFIGSYPEVIVKFAKAKKSSVANNSLLAPNFQMADNNNDVPTSGVNSDVAEDAINTMDRYKFKTNIIVKKYNVIFNST